MQERSIEQEPIENFKEPEIIYNPNLKELNKKAFKILEYKITELLKTHEQINIGLCGGRSPSGIYSLLRKADLPWDQIHWFFTDERIYNYDSNDTNRCVIESRFINQAIKENRLPKSNYHPYLPDDTPDRGAQLYSAELQKHGGKCHIVILGVGEDGHCASLFPDHPSINNESPGYVLVDQAPKPPSVRISMSKNMILDVDFAMLIFVGDGKKDAYHLFKTNKTNISSCPARLAYSVKEAKVVTNIQ